MTVRAFAYGRKDHVWIYDFLHHCTHDGRALRLLTLVDEYTKECLAIDVERKLNSESVLERLGELFVHRGVSEGSPTSSSSSLASACRRAPFGSTYPFEMTAARTGAMRRIAGRHSCGITQKRSLLRISST